MAKTTSKPTDAEQVSAYIQKLDKQLAEAVEYTRQLILSADKEIAEHIKWNSPAFYYTGDMKPFDPKEYKRDLMVMNLRRNQILLVLPTGANIKDSTGLLEGKYTDGRRLITLKDLDDVKSKEKKLKTVIKSWLKQVEK
jgi:hypothetical protein